MMIKKLLAFLIITMIIVTPKKVSANEVHRVKATSYCLEQNPTAIGTRPRYGVVAGKREWLGKTCVIWLDDGDGQIKPENYYGIFCFEDVGGSDAIKAGYVIDLWLEGYENAKNFGCKDMIIQIVDSEG